MKDILLEIKRRRKILKIKQSEIAEKLCIAKETYNHIENGKIRLTLENYLNICKILKIDPCSLIEEQTTKTVKLTDKEIAVLDEIYKKIKA